MLRYRAKQLAVGVLIHLPESLRRCYSVGERLDFSAWTVRRWLMMLRRAPWPV